MAVRSEAVGFGKPWPQEEQIRWSRPPGDWIRRSYGEKARRRRGNGEEESAPPRRELGGSKEERAPLWRKRGGAAMSPGETLEERSEERLKNLTSIDLSYNNLTGDFSTVLYACSALELLDLSNNQLSGRLPDDIDKLSSEMQHLNLSNNGFNIGVVPSAIGRLSKLKSLQLDTNSFINNVSYPGAAIGGLAELDTPALASNPARWTTDHLVHNAVDVNRISSTGTTTGDPLYRLGVIDDSSDTYRRLTVKKMQNETRSVDAELENRRQTEETTLGMIVHPNIIILLGYIRRNEMILILYEDMENGSLDKWIHHNTQAGERRLRPPLGWRKRLAIVIDVAGAILYMHHGCRRPIIHGDIKPANILLDGNFKAKISGFSYARRPQHAVGKRPSSCRGLRVFCSRIDWLPFNFAAEYADTEVSEKVDVYSFGVVLLEIVTGKVVNDQHGHLTTWAKAYLNTWARHGYDDKLFTDDVLDNDIASDAARYLKEMKAVFKLGVECTMMDPQRRPSMQTVLRRLRQCARWWRRFPCFV
uniref:non-specific serine/threonine protein kinase n=1 Tax=Oryza rufipogon TaxID=4529 RepID=A0A0E0NC07_ORYRU